MVLKRSRKGCPECRARKIKCDEEEPECGPCRKTSRKCHLQDSLFKRHGFSPRSPRTRSSAGIARPAETASPISADASSASFLIQQPSSTSPLPAGSSVVEGATATENQYGDEIALDEDETFSFEPIPSHPPPYYTGDSTLALAATPATTSDSSHLEPTVESLKDTPEELFLLRRYSECIAPWMDLLYRYEVFSREVLTLARQHPILRYAACAVAAKQLGQIKDPGELISRNEMQMQIAAKMARGRHDFVWYGIKYYDKAIQTLVKSITPPEDSTVIDHVSPAISLSGGDLMIRAEGQDPIVRLLGTCILIQYEHLSANRDAWSGHLTGFSKLLDLIDDGQLLLPNPLFEQVYPWTKNVMEMKAGFWNFVANDLEESFVSHRKTRVDVDNLALWRNMGLLINDDGGLTLDDGPQSLSSTPEHARDKVLAYTLIRLLCKLVCYIAPGSQPLPDPQHVMPAGHHSLIQNEATFLHLENEFDTWIQLLSPSFHPDGTFYSNTAGATTGALTQDGGLFSYEHWFSNDLCSTIVLYYHMARMLLLIHRPPNLMTTPPSSSLTAGAAPTTDLLRTFQDIQRKLQHHAGQVIATVRGSPCEAVRVRAIQPLYVAGRCCTKAEDRRRLLGMLTDIQDRLGIATGYRVEALLAEWDVSRQDLGVG